MPFALFPAVATPDSRVSGNIRPDCTDDIFIDITHLHDLEARLLQIFAYWKSHADARNAQMGGKAAVKGLVDLLIPTRTLQPRIAELFAQENRTIEELTRQQFKILSILRYQSRAAIIGGAGTGKTLLAIEKSVQLADAGSRTLLLCFNKNLADWIERRINHPNILVSTFHGMVGRARHWAGLSGSGKRMDWDEFREQAPEIMLNALDIIRASDDDIEKYLFDAIIVDEAQDFEDEWWIPIPDLFKDVEQGVFYVFFDDNQRIFTQISNVPMDAAPLYLDENLRNAQHIHERLLPYSRARTKKPNVVSFNGSCTGSSLKRAWLPKILSSSRPLAKNAVSGRTMTSLAVSSSHGASIPKCRWRREFVRFTVTKGWRAQWLF
jgi:hypothetical protein